MPGVRVALRDVPKMVAMIKEYDVIFFNMLLHDVSNFREHALYYGTPKTMHTELLTSHGMSNITYRHKRIDGRFEFEKHLPIDYYLQVGT